MHAQNKPPLITTAEYITLKICSSDELFYDTTMPYKNRYYETKTARTRAETRITLHCLVLIIHSFN